MIRLDKPKFMPSDGEIVADLDYRLLIKGDLVVVKFADYCGGPERITHLLVVETCKEIIDVIISWPSGYRERKIISCSIAPIFRNILEIRLFRKTDVLLDRLGWNCPFDNEFPYFEHLPPFETIERINLSELRQGDAVVFQHAGCGYFLTDMIIINKPNQNLENHLISASLIARVHDMTNGLYSRDVYFKHDTFLSINDTIGYSESKNFSAISYSWVILKIVLIPIEVPWPPLFHLSC